jgi:WD40 repeat protein
VVARRVGPGGGIAFGSLLVHGDSTPPQVLDPNSGAVKCALGQRPTADATVAGEYAVTVRNGVGSIWRLNDCKLLRVVGRVGETAVRLVPSPNGQRVAFVSGREARVLDLPTRRIVSLLAHPGAITSVAFDASATAAVTGGRDRLARIWNATTGQRLHELVGHTGRVLDVAITRDGRSIATASTDGTARIWDATSGMSEATLFGHTRFVQVVDFSPDGTVVVTGSDDGTARTWALNGRRRLIFAGHTGAVVDALFSPDGHSVLTGGEDGTVRLWDAGTRPDLGVSELPAPQAAVTTASSSDGAMAQPDGVNVRLERSDGTTTDLAGHRLTVTSVAFSPDGKRLVSASRDGDAILWDVASGRALRVLRGHFGAVYDARFSPDARWIVTGGPRSVGVWKASDGELTQLLYGPEGPFTAAAFLEDSRTIVAKNQAGAVVTYECRICGGISELLEFAAERLAVTGRELTPEERELYFG